MKTKLTFLIIAAALAAATAGRAQTVISYSTDGGAQALETGSVRQTVLDTATLEVSYHMEWLRRPDSKEPMQDLLLLQAGGKVTKFRSEEHTSELQSPEVISYAVGIGTQFLFLRDRKSVV